MQYYLFSKKIRKLNPRCITVDVFDTVLLRKRQPEFWRFYKLAVLYSDILAQYGLQISWYNLYTLRTHFNTILRSAQQECGRDYETNQAEIFACIINDIARKQGTLLSISQRKTAINTLQRATLEYELTQLWSNLPLIKALQEAKNSGAQIYFVSDMYLTSSQIATLLEKKGVEVFDGGMSSADTFYGKSSGRIFSHLQVAQPSYDPTSSIHIGDKHQADVVQPKTLGTQTYWLVLPLHRLNHMLAKLQYKLAWIWVKKREQSVLNNYRKSILNKQFSNSPMSSDKEAQYLGWIFAPAIIGYLSSLAHYSLATNRTVVFITGESEALSKLYRQLGFIGDQQVPDINRTAIMQAYAYVLHRQGLSLNTIVKVAKKLIRRQSNTFALQTLGVIEKESKLFATLHTADVTKQQIQDLTYDLAIKQWHTQYQNTVKLFAKLGKNRPLVLADVGWNDTIQTLLQEILLHNKNSVDIAGYYMGRTGSNIFGQIIPIQSHGYLFNSLHKKSAQYLYQPEVWESFLNKDNINNTTRKHILEGLQASIDYYIASKQSPDEYWHMYQPLLYKVLKRPTKRTIEIMASLQFDYGTVDESIHPLVNIMEKRWRVYLRLLLSTRKFKQFYFEQGWKWGSATYYHYRLAYRLWRRVSKKPSY